MTIFFPTNFILSFFLSFFLSLARSFVRSFVSCLSMMWIIQLFSKTVFAYLTPVLLQQRDKKLNLSRKNSSLIRTWRTLDELETHLHGLNYFSRLWTSWSKLLWIDKSPHPFGHWPIPLKFCLIKIDWKNNTATKIQ